MFESWRSFMKMGEVLRSYDAKTSYRGFVGFWCSKPRRRKKK